MVKAPGRLRAGPPKAAGMSSRSGAPSVESFPRRSGAVLRRERRSSPFFGEGELHSPCPLVSCDERSTLNLPLSPSLTPGISLQNTDCPAHPIVIPQAPQGVPQVPESPHILPGPGELNPLTASSVSPFSGTKGCNCRREPQEAAGEGSWGFGRGRTVVD